MAEPFTSLASSTAEELSPIPMSFPTMLRNPSISDQFTHLRTSTESYVAPAFTKKKRDQYEGKRWVRRKDNARFAGNRHVVFASKGDVLTTPLIRPTFPEPLPSYLSRNTKVPSATPPARDAISANAGRFSLSMKGMRRELRRSGGRAEGLVQAIEEEVVRWLEDGGTLFSPDIEDVDALLFPGKPLGSTGAILELCRTPQRLVWSIADDAFIRYVVHCVARYHEIVSFSKETNGHRLTYLLRPNVTRPDFRALSSLDTPPVTDLESSSIMDTESDFMSDRGGDSEGEPPTRILTAISEGSDTPYLLRYVPLPYSELPLPDANNDEAWSVIGDTDAEGDESCNKHALSDTVGSLFLGDDPDRALPSVSSHLRQIALRSRIWDHSRGRSSSSPSRSPARRPIRVVRTLVDPPRPKKVPPKSFYDYLFS